MYERKIEEPITMTEAEYLAFEEKSEFKHEHQRGEIIDMSGDTVRHGLIRMNIGTHLNNQLGDRDCSVLSPDVRVHIASKGTYRYPDVTVFCGDPAYVDGRSDTILNPVVLVEVLSPESMQRDQGAKLKEYTQIETLQAYLLIAQDAIQVQHFLRHESGDWLYSLTEGLDGEIVLPTLDCTLSLAKIYQRVRFDEPEGDNPPGDEA